MKVDLRRIEAFITNADAVRIVLFHGEDTGRAHEWADRLTFATAGSANDPFAVSDLERGSINALPAELSSLVMTGRRRVVRLRDCGDFAVDSIRRALDAGGRGLIVAEGGLLPARSKLRTFVETLQEGAAFACFPPESRDKAELLRANLAVAEISLDDEAASWILSRSVDHATAAREAEKLVVFAGRAGTLNLNDVVASLGEVGLASLEHALFSATAGLVDLFDRGMTSAIADGVTAVQTIRYALQHLYRLSEIHIAVSGGFSVREAAKSARPPVSARFLVALDRSLSVWTDERLEVAAEDLLRAELACKQTGAPGEVIARHAITRIMLQAKLLSEARVRATG